jgi:hypothetical protein
MAAVHPGALATGALQKEEEEEERSALLHSTYLPSIMLHRCVQIVNYRAEQRKRMFLI